MEVLSKATVNNWKRLNTSKNNRLTSRANKTASKRQVAANNYLLDDKSKRLLDVLISLDYDIKDVMFSLCVRALEQTRLIDKQHVQTFLRKLSGYKLISVRIEPDTFRAGVDTLGYIYQSLLNEGRRNEQGVYYTPNEITKYLTHNIIVDSQHKFLDPCCGSGAFLINVSTKHPENLYGLDIDPIAVMIASVNLLIKFPEHEFLPNVYQHDFLSKSLFDTSDIPYSFDYIYTNPPWGADRVGKYTTGFSEILSHEKSSMTILESLRRLRSGGQGCFVLPTSLIKIKAHSDIRRFITQQTCINNIHMLSGSFDGVFTDFFAIELSLKHTETQKYTLHNCITNTNETIELTKAQQQNGEIQVNSITNLDAGIIKKIEDIEHFNLSGSIWGLGIVTGDNKSKLHETVSDGEEKIYTGKQVDDFRLNDASKFIKFNPSELQQCAPESVYRAPEKLVYRFISRYPIVAYDDTGSLCLNSANIVIPQIKGISIKSIAAILNSAPYRYYYSLKFHDIKVLKSNLSSMPLPVLSKEQDFALSNFTDRARLNGLTSDMNKELNEIIYSILNLTLEEQSIIEKWKN